MRDLFVTLVIFGSLPFILWRPYIGILVWSWLAFMNPHKLAWGFATQMPFALIVAVTTLVALLISREPKRIPWTRESIVLLLFVIWMAISTLDARYSWLAWDQWDKVWRIQLMTFVTLMLINERHRLHLMVWVIAVSLGFYGIKGGIWVLSTGGAHRVLGPADSFIAGNNEIGLALIMVVPLLRYLQLNATHWFIRWGLLASIPLTFIAIVGTHSRGALVGIAAMAIFFLLKTRKKFAPLLLMVAFVAALPTIMPAKWFERMETIENYQQDASAQSRLRAWRRAFHVATQEPLTGGGYNVLIGLRETDAHSIYFEVLGEHGFVGLALFLLLGWFTWRSGTWVIRRTKRIPELKWARDLAAMIQVSLVGYASAGAFLGLAYFDLYYALVATMIMTSIVVQRALTESALEVVPEDATEVQRTWTGVPVQSDAQPGSAVDAGQLREER